MSEIVNGDEYLNVGEVLEYLHTSQATFAKWRKQLNIKSYTIPLKAKQVFFRKSDLEPLASPQVIPNSD